MRSNNNTADTLLTGRESEVEILKNLLKTNESELVALYGRRRVGKSFLIKKVYAKELVFTIIGTKNAEKEEQLQSFAEALTEAMELKFPIETPKSWKAAFKLLKQYITEHKAKSKKVIMIDELQWLASPKSGFLQSFDHFWNAWAVDQNIIVIICGSAASWMIENVINDTGGLHNRVTKKIHLQPFTLRETEQYFKSRGISMPRVEVINVYMALGGIPFYLREVEIGETSDTAIDRICFGAKAPLYGEFENLYKALFVNAANHIKIIGALATKWKGLSRNEIVKITKFESGGGLSKMLKELEESSFITSYKAFDKKQRDVLYRLTDEYSLFYLTHIVVNEKNKGAWSKLSKSPSIKSWAGYAFESLCFKHIDNIKKTLGISGIYTNESGYMHKGNDVSPAFQIDMLIDRNDMAINVCEAKYFSEEYTIKSQAEFDKIKKRKSSFMAVSNTRKQVIMTLITTVGLADNKYQHAYDKVLNVNALFGNND
jgi:uncharacterized protein